MHELAICQALMSQVETIARDNHAARVIAITVGMGPLSGVEEQLLKNAYPIASADTVAAEAELVIQLSPVRVRCSSCNKESTVAANRLICNHCGDWRTELLSGDELILLRVELDKPEQLAATALH
jgi:hydrogenase nickel incorporation protein HypA/HybF